MTDVDSPLRDLDATAALVLGSQSSATERAACLDHLTGTPLSATNVVAVTFDQSPDEWLDEWRVRVGERPARVAIVGVGHGTRSASARAPPDPVDEIARLCIAAVEDPAELDALGDVLTDVLDGWADTDAETVLCFRSLTDLLDHVDRKAVFRFLHALNAHLDVVGARGHFHVDPTRHDPRTITTLEPLFDAIVNLPPDREAGAAAPRTPETVSVEYTDVPDGTDDAGSVLSEITEAEAADAASEGRNEADAASEGRNEADAASEGRNEADSAIEEGSVERPPSADGDITAGLDGTGRGVRDAGPDDDGSASLDGRSSGSGTDAVSGTAGPADGGAIQVLVVEESPDVAELVAAVLEGRGFATTTTVDPDEAADLLDGGFDCVVCGEDLRGTTGLEFVGRVHERDPDVPVMLLARDVEPGRARAVGAAETFVRDREGYRRLAAAVPGAVARRTERRYRNVVQYAGTPLVLAATDGSIEYVNPAFEGFVGDAAQDAVGRDLRTYVAEDDVETADDGWATVLEGDAWEGDLSLAAGSHRVPARAMLSPVTTASGGVRRVVAVLTDVTDHERRAGALRAERDRADETVKLLAHDARNVLQAARGNVEFLRESLEEVESSLDRLATLVDDASTVAADTTIDETTTRDLAATARAAWNEVGSDAAEFVVEESRPLVADHDLLARLFENLVTNALEHGGPGVTVTVGTTPDGFYVADDGVGVPADQREAVFEEGYSTGGSTGLGLTVVQRVALAHGWEVDLVESESGGARFEFTGVTWG